MRSPTALWMLALVVLAAALVLLAITISPLIGIAGFSALAALVTATADDRSMLTNRGRGMLLAGTILTVVGVLHTAAASVALLGLTLLGWITFEWIRFALRARFALPWIEAERTVSQIDRRVAVGWAGPPFEIVCRFRNPSRWHCPFVEVKDVHSLGSTAIDAVVLDALGNATVDYVLPMTVPGVLRLAGFHLRLVDANGFFQSETFLTVPAVVTVLPQLTNDEGRQRADKRFNSLPPPGTHRLRMPGSGSELLDLRDYRPGDPPKMIAWKASARRDRLITKEFESEVPVRCTLILDCGSSVRAGTDTTPLTKLASTAAGILLAASGNRDLVGVAFFDATNSRFISPARTSSHVMQLLNDLARAAALVPDVPVTDAAIVADHLELHLRLRVPTRFDRFANLRPWGLFWKPLLDSRFGWLIFLPYLLTPMLIMQSAWLDLAARTGRTLRIRTGRFALDTAVFVLDFLLMLMLPSVLATLFWLAFGFRGFLPAARKTTRRRKQLAAILGDSAAEVERLQRDDIAFAKRAGKFFSEAGLRLPARRFDRDGADRFLEPERFVQAARVITRAVSRARDNELYVILADLLDAGDGLKPLLRAVKLARSRHHHVLVIITWPSDVPIEREQLRESKTPNVAVRHVMCEGTHHRYDALRRMLTRSGATVLRLTDRDTVRTVLDHLDRLRGARSRR